MCTVIFSPRRGGYVLGMNRDEQLTRVTALPPRRHRVAGRDLIFPAEPTGGTWIGLNDHGNCLALVNWYSVRARMSGEPVSRGHVIPAALPMLEEAQTGAYLREMPLRRLRPFRLIGIFRRERTVVEWRWNHQSLERMTHPWSTGIWISSGFDEASAEVRRRGVFQRALRESGAGTLPWLRGLHRSHTPERGAYSLCMHRADAATVSYTEVGVNGNAGMMRYLPGAPCCANARASITRFTLRLISRKTGGRHGTFSEDGGK